MHGRRWVAPALAALALAALVGCSASNGGSGARAYLDRVIDRWRDTPAQLGLGPILEQEARIAEQHAAFAAQKPDDLRWMKGHVRHVRHAIDPATERRGPGLGYGVLRAARGVATQIGLAAAAADASPNIRLHAAHVALCVKNVVKWSNRIIVLSKNVLAARNNSREVRQAAAWVREIHATTRQLLNGSDLDGDGLITWMNGEGGIAQARRQIDLLKQGEGW